MTFPRPDVTSLTTSPTVGASSRAGLPEPFDFSLSLLFDLFSSGGGGNEYTGWYRSSAAHETVPPAERSHHSLLIMPCLSAEQPVNNDACPGPVVVIACA